MDGVWEETKECRDKGSRLTSCYYASGL